MALRWVLFDLNGTLVNPSVLAQPLGDSADDEALVQAAFDDAVMQAMVITLGGAEAQFADLIEAGLRRRLLMAGRDEAAADAALGLLGSMPAFIEAPSALERLRGVGLRLGVLTQSSVESAEGVLRFAGLRDRLELVVSAPASGAFKPDPRPYRHGVEQTGASAREVALVAAHWWDVAGAKRAGLLTGWVARSDLVLPASVPEPDVRGRDLDEVAEGLAKLAGRPAGGARRRPR
jgi:2-haloacid dehalogenase